MSEMIELSNCRMKFIFFQGLWGTPISIIYFDVTDVVTAQGTNELEDLDVYIVFVHELSYSCSHIIYIILSCLTQCWEIFTDPMNVEPIASCATYG